MATAITPEGRVGIAYDVGTQIALRMFDEHGWGEVTLVADAGQWSPILRVDSRGRILFIASAGGMSIAVGEPSTRKFTRALSLEHRGSGTFAPVNVLDDGRAQTVIADLKSIRVYEADASLGAFTDRGAAGSYTHATTSSLAELSVAGSALGDLAIFWTYSNAQKEWLNKMNFLSADGRFDQEQGLSTQYRFLASRVDREGNAVALWSHGSDVFVSSRTNATRAFSQPIRVMSGKSGVEASSSMFVHAWAEGHGRFAIVVFGRDDVRRTLVDALKGDVESVIEIQTYPRNDFPSATLTENRGRKLLTWPVRNGGAEWSTVGSWVQTDGAWSSPFAIDDSGASVVSTSVSAQGEALVVLAKASNGSCYEPRLMHYQPELGWDSLPVPVAQCVPQFAARLRDDGDITAVWSAGDSVHVATSAR